MASRNKGREISPAQRKRRAHKKSRCRVLGVSCVYGSKLTAETLYSGTCFSAKSSPAPNPPRSPAAPLPVIPSSRPADVFQLAPVDVELIEKFQLRVVRTIGSERTGQHYADNVLPLAFSNSILMHAVLAYARFHDISARNTPIARRRRDIYHWNTALKLLHDRLSTPLDASETSAVHMAASLVSLGTVASTEAETPYEAWPLRPPSVLDLMWLRMCSGKMLVFEMAGSSRPHAAGPLRDCTVEIEGIVARQHKLITQPFDPKTLPTGLCEVFGFDGAYTDSPYYCGIAGLADLYGHQEIDGKHHMLLTAMVWGLEDRFQKLLYQKDEKALLILLYWYAKLCSRRIWWLWRHSWTEGLAICIYLERAWAKQPKLLNLLLWPRVTLTAASEQTFE